MNSKALQRCHEDIESLPSCTFWVSRLCFIVMCKGQLVKLKHGTLGNYSTPSGSMSFSIENDCTYGIILGFYDYEGTYEILIDGEILYNIYTDSLEAVT